MRKIYKDRLLKLAKLLRKNAKNKKGVKFDLGGWGESTDSSMPLSCNTTACAMGLAAISGIFKDEGLDYNVRPSRYLGNPASIKVVHKDRLGYRSYGFDAASKLFDLPYGDATQLFSNVGYRGKTTKGAKGELNVANKISQYVRSH